MTVRTKVKRVPKRGFYDKETIYSILDKEWLCHMAFVHEGYPVVIPTLYGRKDNYLYVHGSTASRMMKDLKSGIPMSLSIARVNGLVLARSGFHHSANYESVVLFGNAEWIDDDNEKTAALEYISEHIIKGRWDEVRGPNEKELKGTLVLKIPIEEATAKIRTGGPIDDKEDYQFDIWAGVLPIEHKYLEPIVDELMEKELPVPGSVIQLLEKD